MFIVKISPLVSRVMSEVIMLIINYGFILFDIPSERHSPFGKYIGRKIYGYNNTYFGFTFIKYKYLIKFLITLNI